MGQEQDSPGGSFNSEQSFLGRLGPTAMWPHLLSETQLAAIYEDCSADRSVQISNVSLAGGGAPALWSWKDTLAGIKGNLQVIVFSTTKNTFWSVDVRRDFDENSLVYIAF